jgi:hypothetical protein
VYIFSAKMVIEPPACSNEAQKNTVKTGKKLTAIIHPQLLFIYSLVAAFF